MTSEQVKILSQFFQQVAGLAGETLTAFVECEKPIEKVSPQRINNEKRIIDRKELAERLGVSVRTISNLQNEGLPTIQRFGRRILFDYEDVLTWAKDKEIKGRRKNKLRVVS